MLKEDFIRSMKNDLGKYQGFTKHKGYNSFFQDVASAFDTVENYNKAKSDFERKNLEIFYVPAKQLLDDAEATAKKMSDEVLQEDIQSNKLSKKIHDEAIKLYAKSAIVKKTKALLDEINKFENDLKSIKLERYKYQVTDKYYHSYVISLNSLGQDERTLKRLLAKDILFYPTAESR